MHKFYIIDAPNCKTEQEYILNKDSSLILPNGLKDCLFYLAKSPQKLFSNCLIFLTKSPQLFILAIVYKKKSVCARDN